jgi:16S rRNA (guanine(1405)-N(7))-methyltransferase
MGLPAATEYRAFDIDLRLCALVDHYLKRAGQPGGAAIWDLLTPPPREASCADLVFCLKTLPLLEQQARGASERLLQSLSTRVWVISFPARSLGGRDKGMRAHYDALMCAQAGRLRLPLQRFDYPTETFYILGPCP